MNISFTHTLFQQCSIVVGHDIAQLMFCAVNSYQHKNKKTAAGINHFCTTEFVCLIWQKYKNAVALIEY
jgi:hypothetical protein